MRLMPSCEGLGESKNRWDAGNDDGGYCAADGTVKHANQAASAARNEDLPGPRAEYVESAPKAHPEAVKTLTKAFTKPKLPKKSTSDNAARTAARAPRPDLSAGVTSSGDAVYVSAAALKGRSREGIDLDELTVSAQVGMQSEVQAAVGRGSFPVGEHFRVSAELLSAQAAAGVHNPDGSTGLNLSAHATLGSFKGEYENGKESVSVSGGAGVGASGSIGTKDMDGQAALCVAGKVGPVTVDYCGPTGVPSRQQSDTVDNGTEGAGGR
jgi:hypothetical protein